MRITHSYRRNEDDERMSKTAGPPAGQPEARDAGRHMARLRALAERLDHRAALIRNGGFNPEAETQAGRLADDAFAIRWALRRIAPERETVGQVFAALRRAGPNVNRP